MSRSWPLRFMLLLFMAPALLAVMVLSKPDLLHSKSVQHGTFMQHKEHLDSSHAVFTPHNWHVFYLQPAACDAACTTQQQTLKQLHVALGAAKSRVVVKSLAATELNISAEERSVIIVDPQGRYVMQYSNPNDFSGILKDLRRLLKYSHV